MESPPITLSSRISFWTHFHATRAIVKRLWSTYIAWGFFAGVPLLVLIIMLWRGEDIFTPHSFGLPAWAIAPGGVVFMLGFIPLIQCINILTMRRRNPSVEGVQTYTISLDGYTVKGSLFDTTLKWEAFLKAIETKKFILLYVSSRCAYFIPKAAATQSELLAVRRIIHEKLGSKAKLQVD